MRILRCGALALAFAVVPACSSLPPAGQASEGIFSKSQSLEIRAYALVETYSAALDAAAILVARPHTPAALVSALARAELAATPAAQSVLAALAVYREASRGTDPGAARVAEGELAQALAQAGPPITALSIAAGG